MADLNSRELGLRSGQLDVIYGLQDGKWVDQLSSAPNVKVDVFGVGEVDTLYFNVTKPPFDNLTVRQAVASALNRDEFLALYGTQVAQKVFSPVPEALMAGGLTEQELAAQAWTTAYDPTKPSNCWPRPGWPMASRSASSRPRCRIPRHLRVMQAQLARVGIKMDVKVVDHATMHDQIRKDVNPLVVYVAFRPTADTYLTQFFHSDSIVVTARTRNQLRALREVDEQIDKAATSLTPPNRRRCGRRPRQALADMVAYPIQYTNQVYARATNVDYGHELKSVIQLYPASTRRTRLKQVTPELPVTVSPSVATKWTRRLALRRAVDCGIELGVGG